SILFWLAFVKSFRIFRYRLSYHFPFKAREGLLIAFINSNQTFWGEIAPLSERSIETLAQAYEQLVYVLKQGSSLKQFLHLHKRDLYSSVYFGLSSALDEKLSARCVPVYALLTGTFENILKQAERAFLQGYLSVK